MSVTFLLMGFMLWSLSTLSKLFICVSLSIGWKSIWQSVLISLRSQGLLFTFTLLQLVSGLWVASGIYFSVFGENTLAGLSGAVIVGCVFLIPLWAAAAITGRKTKAQHAKTNAISGG